MKFTDEERKEVAKNLREVNPTSLNSDSCMGYACLWEALKRSFPRIKENAHDVLDELDNLADLIEPEPEQTFDEWLKDVKETCFANMEGCGEPEWSLFSTINDAIGFYLSGKSGYGCRMIDYDN